MIKQRLMLDWIAIDASAPLPRYRQLYAQLRTAIVAGRLPAGSLLPSSRALAQDLGVSRNTVLNAYDQLIAEGYLETSEASGTLVAHSVAAQRRPDDKSEVELGSDTGAPPLSRRGLVHGGSSSVVSGLPDSIPFIPGIPAFDEFPAKTWSRLLAAQACRMQPELASYDYHEGGYLPLREALSTYLQTARMVECTAEQVFVVSSGRAGLDLIYRLIADPGAACLMEEPGYNTAKIIARAAGLKIIPVPVDSEGMRIDGSEARSADARIAYVTPSHQWPMGISLSARRRQQLLKWARQRNAWIVEDDYDSEFRFRSRPLATLQGLDRGQRVIYLGTFSKVMFPTLRTAYVVVPRVLVPVFQQAVYFGGQEPPLHIQAALADFICEGHFATYIRRMRRVYERRQGIFFEALVRFLGSHMTIERPAGGFQIALALPQEYPAAAASLAAAAVGIHARPISLYAQTDHAPNALHLGFAAVPDRRIQPATKALAAAILSCRQDRQ